MHRRNLLKLGIGLSALPAAATDVAAVAVCSEAGGAKRAAAVYIPGYSPEYGYAEGISVKEHPRFTRAIPPGYDGPVRMMTRIGPDGDIRQALFPVGHAVAISPDGKLGFFCAMEGGNHVAFDPETLDLVASGEPPGDGWVGGGHGAYVEDGKLLAVSERAPLTGYLGDPQSHYGRVTLRDPETLGIVETFSTHGISPHDLRLLPDGRHVAIAHYGSTYPPGGTFYGVPRHIVEPSITIVDLTDGKLIDKIETGSSDFELRHLCVADTDTLFAIQVETAERADELLYRMDEKIAYEIEETVDDVAYLPAATLIMRRQVHEVRNAGDDAAQSLMRHGTSIAYDEQYAEIIATFPGSHRVMVFDAKSGAVRRSINCAAIGLDHPSGLAIVPGGEHYVVTGYWKNLFVFRRGTHELVREMCAYTTFFGHSHIAVG